MSHGPIGAAVFVLLQVVVDLTLAADNSLVVGLAALVVALPGPMWAP